MSVVGTSTKSSPEMETETRYQKYVALKDRFGWPVTDGAFSVANPMDFLREVGFGPEETEGGSSESYFNLLDTILGDLKSEEVTDILEIGFNAGMSSVNFLNRFRNARITSFDIGLHSYVGYAKLYLDKRYPGRHQLILGDSLASVPKTDLPIQDIIFIDGNHLYDYARGDILNCRRFADSQTLVLIDNMVPHRGQGKEVYRAYLDLVEEGVLVHEQFLVFKDGINGIGVAHYRDLDRNEPITSISQGQRDLLERYIPIYAATEALEAAPTLAELELAYQKGRKAAGSDSVFMNTYQRLKRILKEL
jgi:hypothetical protein